MTEGMQITTEGFQTRNTETSDLTRIERIGAHSHIRGLGIVSFLSFFAVVLLSFTFYEFPLLFSLKVHCVSNIVL